MPSLLASVRSRLLGAPEAIERRAFRRIAADLDAQVVAIDGVELSWPIRGTIEDLSAGGLRLRAGTRDHVHHSPARGSRGRYAPGGT